jgi:hypothetical protein
MAKKAIDTNLGIYRKIQKDTGIQSASFFKSSVGLLTLSILVNNELGEFDKIKT